MKRQQTVFVRNNSPFPFRDRYNGENFTIEAFGGIEEMLVETAELCLGFGQEDKARCLRRLGWAFTLEDMGPALSRLGMFSFHMTEQEAESFKPIASSAPGGDETGAASSGAAPGVALTTAKGHRTNASVLAKLANAQANAG